MQNVGVQADVRKLPGLASGSRQNPVLAAQRRDGIALDQELKDQTLACEGKQWNEIFLLANAS